MFKYTNHTASAFSQVSKDKTVYMGAINTLAHVLCMLVETCACGLHVRKQTCVRNIMVPPGENRWEFFERLSSYLTTNTSRRVNYSTQQTSFLWQNGPGNACLLLLGLSPSLVRMGVGQAETRNVGLISCFPFLIAV